MDIFIIEFCTCMVISNKEYNKEKLEKSFDQEGIWRQKVNALDLRNNVRLMSRTWDSEKHWCCCGPNAIRY